MIVSKDGLKQRFSLSNMRIRNRLVLIYSSLIFLSIFFISVLLTVYSRQIITQKSVDYTVGILEQMGENIDMNLQQIDIASYLIFTNEDVLRLLKYGENNEYQGRTNIESLLVNVMFSRRDIDSIYLFANPRIRYGTTYTYNTPDLSYDDLKEAADQGDGKMVWLHTNKDSGIIQAVRTVRTLLMEPVGLLQINLRESSMTSIISEQLSNLNGSVFIIDGQGKIISSLNNSKAQHALDDLTLSRIRSEITFSSRAGHFTEEIGGEQHIVTFYQSRFVDGWQYISVIPIREMTKDVTRLLHISVIGSLIISGLFVLLSFFVSGGIANPIKEIAFRMKRLEPQTQMPNIQYSGEDEIAYLSKSLNGMIHRINTLIEEVYEQKLLRSEQELKTLQAQINPHFLYNTLDTVNWMAITHNVNDIGVIVRSLSSIMRYSINNEDAEVTIEEELKHVKNYCHIQMFRFTDRLVVTYHIDDDILDHYIPKLILQPIVENAILHGFKGKGGVCEVSICGYIRQHTVCMEIADNGVGIDPDRLSALLDPDREELRSKDGIGIRNVDRRLKLKYGKEYGLEVTSVMHQGTRVFLRLPI